ELDPDAAHETALLEPEITPSRRAGPPRTVLRAGIRPRALVLFRHQRRHRTQQCLPVVAPSNPARPQPPRSGAESQAHGSRSGLGPHLGGDPEPRWRPPAGGV